MGFNVIKGDEIKVAGIVVTIYGEPSTGKTSFGYMCKNPIVMDFDGGAQRSRQKTGKPTVQIKDWSIMEKNLRNLHEEFEPYDTVVIDTFGKACEAIMDWNMINLPAVREAGAKNKFAKWEALKDASRAFFNRLKASGKDVVVVCHSVIEENNKKEKWAVPDVPGSSWDMLTRDSDFIGYLSYHEDQRTLTFDGSGSHIGKNCSGVRAQEIPDFKDNPEFVQNLMKSLKDAVNKDNVSQEETVTLLKQFSNVIKKIETIEAATEFTAKMAKQASMPVIVKEQIKAAFKARLVEAGIEYNAKTKQYEYKPEEPEEEPFRESFPEPVQGIAPIAEPDDAPLPFEAPKPAPAKKPVKSAKPISPADLPDGW